MNNDPESIYYAVPLYIPVLLMIQNWIKLRYEIVLAENLRFNYIFRAKKRLDGEDVYGSKIYCTFGKNFDKEGSPKVDSKYYPFFSK